MAAWQAAPGGSCPWVTSTAPISQRVAQLMGQMSLSQEISMVEGHGTSNPYVFYTPAISSLCIPAFGLEDGPAGVADGLTGVTQLPAGVALAATWDPSLAQQYGQVIGAEEFGKGASANLGPTVNIDRDPRWGRSFEALSEDPFLNSALDVAEIDGVQSQDVMSQVKHFAAYNQETYRNTSADNVIVDNRAVQEIYMPSFYAAIKQANAASVMCAYSMVNGNFSCNNSYLETSVLRDEWDFPGFVTSDYGALHSTQGAVQGTDMEQPENTYYGTALSIGYPEGDHPAQRAEHHGAADLDRDVPVQPVQPAAHRLHLGHGHHAGEPGGGHGGRRGGHHAAEERRPGPAVAGVERRHHRRHRPGRLRRADLCGRRQRLRDPVLHGDPAGGHPGRRRVRHQRRLLPGPARPTPRCRPSRPADLSPAYSSTASGGSYTGTLTAPQTGTYVLALTNPCGCYTSTYLSLNGQQILDDPSTPPVHTYSAAVQPDRRAAVHAVDQRPVFAAAVGHAVGARARHQRRGQRRRVGVHRGGRRLR